MCLLDIVQSFAALNSSISQISQITWHHHPQSHYTNTGLTRPCTNLHVKQLPNFDLFRSVFEPCWADAITDARPPQWQEIYSHKSFVYQTIHWSANDKGQRVKCKADKVRTLMHFWSRHNPWTSTYDYIDCHGHTSHITIPIHTCVHWRWIQEQWVEHQKNVIGHHWLWLKVQFIHSHLSHDSTNFHKNKLTWWRHCTTIFQHYWKVKPVLWISSTYIHVVH